MYLYIHFHVYRPSWQGFRNIEIQPQKASHNQEKNVNEKNPSFVCALLFSFSRCIYLQCESVFKTFHFEKNLKIFKHMEELQK